MSYDDPITCCYFNVNIRGDLDLHNKADHFMVTRSAFSRYQTLKTMLAEGTFEVHQLGMRVLLEQLCSELQELWNDLHQAMSTWAEEIGT